MKKKQLRGIFYTLPLSLWISIFFLCPIFIIIIFSFLQKDVYGGIRWIFSLRSYITLFSINYGILFLRTVWVSITVTIICLLLALPSSYAIAQSKHQTFFLFLIIIPFWTNSLIRINAWIAILGNQGFINEFLKKIGLTQNSLSLLYNQPAVILVLIYMFLPYAIFPIFSAIDKFDFSLLEAAQDLGATKAQAIIKILLPGIRSGIITAIIFTFIPIFGAYTVPLLVGGKNSYMIGNVIVDQATKIRNWPLASAFAVLITIFSTVGIIWMIHISLKQTMQKEKQNGEKNVRYI